MTVTESDTINIKFVESLIRPIVTTQIYYLKTNHLKLFECAFI